MSDSGQNRVFHYAVLASLALHAIVIYTVEKSDQSFVVTFPPAIIARLMAPEPAPAPAPAEARPERKADVAKPAPRVIQPAPQLPVPEVKAERPAPPVEAPAAPQIPVAAPPVAAVARQPAATSPPVREAPESLSRDQYRLQLIDEARRHKRYPPLARENNWQGEVPVRVLVGANGRASVTLRGSSGYEVLDRQALEMFGQAARAVPVPPALQGKEFALEVRAVYGLEE